MLIVYLPVNTETPRGQGTLLFVVLTDVSQKLQTVLAIE